MNIQLNVAYARSLTERLIEGDVLFILGSGISIKTAAAGQPNDVDQPCGITGKVFWSTEFRGARRGR